MYISHLPLIATLFSGYGACYAFNPRAFNSKSHLSVRGSTSQLFSSINDENIVVVGGGIAGLTVAHYIKNNDQSNKFKVTLLDKEADPQPGEGSSATVNAVGGYDSKYMKTTDEQRRRFVMKTINNYDTWLNEVEASENVVPQGFLYAIDESISLSRVIPDPSENIVSRDEIQEPLLNDEIEKWIYNKDSKRIDPQGLLRSMRRSCENKGVKMNLGEQWGVESLTFNDGGDCTGVKVACGEELSGTVVLANGASLNMLTKDKSGNDFGTLPVFSKKTPYVVLKNGDAPFCSQALMSLDSYVLQKSDGIHIGTCGESNSSDVDDGTSEEICNAAIEASKKLVPTIGSFPVDRYYRVDRPMTKDHYPVLGKTEKCDNLYFFGGLNNYGIMMASSLGEILGKLILNKGGVDCLDDDEKAVLDLCRPDRAEEVFPPFVEFCVFF